MIPPARFVPILEKYGIVTNLDKFIWESVCKWLRKWLDAGHAAVPVSVNVSQMDVYSVNVPDVFSGLLKKYDLPASLIKVEITESAYAEDTAVVKDTVRRLREQGFLVLMDDFGSGYSSLNMLCLMPIDALKIDMKFVRNVASSGTGYRMVELVIEMARALGVPAIVEGVEDEAQYRLMKQVGCDIIQGYYFSRPVDAKNFEPMILEK